VTRTVIAESIRRVAADAVLNDSASERFAVAGVVPSAVVAPAHAEQVAEVLALCTNNGWTVEAAGAGTWLSAGLPPARVDVVLTTQNLTHIAEYEPADLTIATGPGLALDKLQRETGRHRQYLPLDPPGDMRGTVGATFATASAGPLRLSQGTPRDHALGLELVTGDGRILRLGGRVVKNVAGYDLVRLVVGSRGTLGVITRLYVRLRSVPLRDVTLVYAAESPGPLLDLCALIHARVRPSALEVFSPSLAERLLDDARWSIAVRVQGNDEAVRDAQDRLRAQMHDDRVSSQGRRPNPRALIASEGATLWAALADLEARAAVMIRIADVPSRLPETLSAGAAIVRRATVAGAATMPVWFIALHAGTGILRLWREDAPRSAEAAAAAEAVVDARRSVGQKGGSVHVSPGARSLAKDLEPWGDVGGTLRLMEGIKREFDPAGILAPGRFVL
jgi:glycolate oxidase FAD binding subunit